MKYKPLDKVRIKSYDWYKENKDEWGTIIFSTESGDYSFTKEDVRLCGQVVTIAYEGDGHYLIAEDDRGYFWIDEMIECKVEEEIPLNIDDFQDDDEIIDIIDEYVHRLKDNECQIDLPEGYQFVDENGNVINARKIVLEKKKKEYPKTYEECCKELNVAVRDLDILDNMLDTTEIIYSKNLDRLLNSFRKILICRDAYWKLYGEENGLGKPWEPDWNDEKQDKHGFYNEIKNTIINSKVFVFPTAKMRDAFYENFKEEIEQCKELL